MVVGLEQKFLFIVQALPEVLYTSQWFSVKIAESNKNLGRSDFCVCALDVDNHSANVNSLASLFVSDCSLFIKHPLNHGKQMHFFF